MSNRVEETAGFATEIRTSKISERIITARLVPYGELALDVPSPHGERFMPGALSKTLQDWTRSIRPLKLFRAHEHREAVGLATGYDAEEMGGPLAEFRVAKTAAGDAVLNEIEEGLLDSISVGFRAIRERRGRDGAREIVEAALIEASIAPMGAYHGAQVLAVRTPSTPVDVESYRLPPAPAIDLEAPLWSGLR